MHQGGKTTLLEKIPSTKHPRGCKGRPGGRDLHRLCKQRSLVCCGVTGGVTHLARQLAAECRWGGPEGIAAGICRCPASPSTAGPGRSAPSLLRPWEIRLQSLSLFRGAPWLSRAPCWGHGLLLSPSRVCYVVVNSSSVAAWQQKASSPQL